VQGSGLRAQSSGLRAQVFRVQGSGLRYSGNKVQGSRFKVQGSKCRVQGLRFRAYGVRHRVQVGPGLYRYTGSRIRHLNPYPRNPTTEKTLKSLSGIIGAGRDQKSRIRLLFYLIEEICRNFRHNKAFGHTTYSADRRIRN
jgi:hypothetical protein